MTGFYSTGSGGAVLVQLDALKALANGGSLKVFTDAAPKDPDTAFAGTLLATWTFSATAFGADTVSGTFPSKTAVTTASFAASTVAAAASGTPASFGIFDSGGTLRATGSASATGSGADLNFSAAFTAGGNVTVSAFTLTQPQ